MFSFGNPAYYAAQVSYYFTIVNGPNPLVRSFKWNLFSSTLTWCYLLCQYNPSWRVVVGDFCTVWFERVFKIWFRYEISLAISRQDFSLLKWQPFSRKSITIHDRSWRNWDCFSFRRMMSSQSLKNQWSSPQSDNQRKSLLIPVIETQENQSSLSRCVKPCYTKYPTY